MKKLCLLYNAARATLNDSTVLATLEAYRHNIKRISALYKQAISAEREELGKVVVQTFKAKYLAEKLQSGEYETIFD